MLAVGVNDHKQNAPAGPADDAIRPTRPPHRRVSRTIADGSQGVPSRADGLTMKFAVRGRLQVLTPLMAVVAGVAAAMVWAAAMGGTALAQGPPSPAAESANTLPQLTGIALVGHRLHVSNGTWTAPPVGYRYRWKRCTYATGRCATISGAASATYRVRPHDLGSHLRAVVTAIVNGGTVTARSRPSPRVGVRPRPSPCAGIAVSPAADVAALVDASPAGSTFCFQPGRYRIERTVFPKSGDRLIGQPRTILDASVDVTGWRRVGTLWAANAPRTTPTFDFGGGYNGSYRFPQAPFADDVFEGDRPLVKLGVAFGGQVIGQGLSSLTAGEYFYDYDQGTIYLGANPGDRRVGLVSLPDGVIHSFEPDVTVRGLTVQGSIGDGIVTGSGANWVVAGNDVRLNHSEGVRVTNGGRILQNYIHDNGTYGIAASGDSMRVLANEVARNNTSRYYFANGGCSDAGGSKITLSTDVDLSWNWYHHNLCIGVWFDINNSGVNITHNHVDGNYENGIDYEISYDGVIRFNEVSGSPHWGILDSASPNVVICDNAVAGNGEGSVILNQGPRTDFPSPYGAHQAVNVTVCRNRISMRSGRAGAQEHDVAGTPFAGIVFSASNRFHDNTYLLADLRRQWFEWVDGPATIAQWRAAGQDPGSSFVVR
jgi:hypothetical protein